MVILRGDPENLAEFRVAMRQFNVRPHEVYPGRLTCIASHNSVIGFVVSDMFERLKEAGAIKPDYIDEAGRVIMSPTRSQRVGLETSRSRFSGHYRSVVAVALILDGRAGFGSS